MCTVGYAPVTVATTTCPDIQPSIVENSTDSTVNIVLRDIQNNTAYCFVALANNDTYSVIIEGEFIEGAVIKTLS